MPQTIPLFPLSIVSFPGEKVNLHIFEPRYKQLINECHEKNLTFGIPAFIDKKIMNYGTEMKVVEISKTYDSGEMDIKTLGLQPFKILEIYKAKGDKLYTSAEVDFMETEADADESLKLQIKEKLVELFGHLGIQKELKSYNSFDIAHYIGMTIQEEYELLTKAAENERQVIVLNHLERIIPVIVRAQKLRQQVKMNGHFKNFPKLDF